MLQPFAVNPITSEQMSPYKKMDGSTVPVNKQLMQQLRESGVVNHDTILRYAPFITLSQSTYQGQNGDGSQSNATRQWPVSVWDQQKYLDYCILKNNCTDVNKSAPTPDDLKALGTDSKSYLKLDLSKYKYETILAGSGFKQINGKSYAQAKMVAFIKAYNDSDDYFDIVYAGFWPVNLSQWFHARVHYQISGDYSTEIIGAYLNNAAYHMGDWEHVTVRVSISQNKVLGVFLGAHGKGRWYYNIGDSLKFQDSSHVKVTAASFSNSMQMESSDIQIDPTKYLENDIKVPYVPVAGIQGGGHTYGYGIDRIVPEDCFWSAYDSNNGGTGIVDITSFLINSTLPSAEDGVSPGENMNWLYFNGEFGEVNHQNFAKALKVDDAISDIGKTGGIVVDGLNSVLDFLDIATDVTSAPQTPIKQGWSKYSEFTYWNQKTTTIFLGYTGENQSLYTAYSTLDAAGWSTQERNTTATSVKGPALAGYNGYLYSANRGTGGEELWYSAFDGNVWTKNIQFGNGAKSTESPALIVYNGKLLCVHRGTGRDQLWYCQFDGKKWSDDIELGSDQKTSKGPALAIYNGLVYCVYRSSNEDKSDLYYCTFDGKSWTKDRIFGNGAKTSAAPALAAMDDGKLYCVYRSSNKDKSDLYYCTFDGDSWAKDQVFGNGAKTSSGPGLASYMGSLYCIYKSSKSNDMWLSVFKDGKWQDNVRFSGSTIAEIALVVCSIDPQSRAPFWSINNL